MARKVHMHIEGVPNPSAMKFVLENGVLTDRPYEFISYNETEFSPLARRLMMLSYVERVLINVNYVTVVKQEKGSPEWEDILYSIRMLIQEHLERDEPILYIGKDELQHHRSDEVVADIITNILDQKIRPAAQADGGDIVFESYENGVLNLSMHGACHFCPHAIQTIKSGVEPLLKSQVPEIKTVLARENRIT